MDIRDPKARTSTTLRDFQRLRSGQLWADFSLPCKQQILLCSSSQSQGQGRLIELQVAASNDYGAGGCNSEVLSNSQKNTGWKFIIMETRHRVNVRKIRAPIKIKSALPPPPPKNPPKKKGILRTWLFLQKERIFPGVHKIGAPISGPRIADTDFTDTRIFLRMGSAEEGVKQFLTRF